MKTEMVDVWVDGETFSMPLSSLNLPTGESASFLLAFKPFTRQVDIWRRCADESEAMLIRQAVDVVGAQEQGLIWSTMQYEHSSPEYAALKRIVESVLSADRAEIILASSEA